VSVEGSEVSTQPWFNLSCQNLQVQFYFVLWLYMIFFCTCIELGILFVRKCVLQYTDFCDVMSTANSESGCTAPKFLGSQYEVPSTD
jgi:hypothetical protein